MDELTCENCKCNTCKSCCEEYNKCDGGCDFCFPDKYGNVRPIKTCNMYEYEDNE